MVSEQIYQHVVILTAILIQPLLGQLDVNIANKYFLEKQIFLYEIVRNVQEPLQNEDWLHEGKSLVTNKTLYLEFTTLMEKYLIKASTSSLLLSNENFFLSDKNHLEELKGLYYFLYNAKDFETLKQNICWARSHVQAQMFIFALTQILMKREDVRDLNLPKIYEIWPQHFLADKYVRNLQHFNYVQWSRTAMYEEIFKQTNVSRNMKCKYAQWWCEQNLEYKIHKEIEKNIVPRSVYGDLRNTDKCLQALEDVDLFWLPVDFSRDLAEFKELNERSVTYLIEDKSWNAYWYYINMGLWLSEYGENDLYGKTLRDWWFWNLQQVVARYKMEDTSKESNAILDPFLINFQGLKYKPLDQESKDMNRFIFDLFAKTQNALNEQTYELKNNTRLPLSNPENFEYFLKENFAIEKVMASFMSLTSKQNSPTVFHYYETMLRSKQFYHYAEIILKLYKSLKTNFEPYKPQDLQSLGMTINDIEITDLRTYFEPVDTDVTNLMRSSDVYFEGKLYWFKSLMARQQNLQHKPFKFILKVTSLKPQAVLVRTFLVQDCLANEAIRKCPTSPQLFQLDTFVSTLVAGYNIIERDSSDFYGYMPSSLTYTELYHLTHLASNDKYQFPLNITLGNCRFPHHFKLPKGLKGRGLPVKFVFVVTAYNYRFHKASSLDCDFSSGILSFDDYPPGYPFDRDVPENAFLGDNVIIKKMKMKIYHEDDSYSSENF